MKFLKEEEAEKVKKELEESLEAEIEEGFCDLVLEDGTIIKAEERERQAKEIYCLPFLEKELCNITDFSKEAWEHWNKNYMKGKCSWEFWESFWKEKNKEEVDSGRDRAELIWDKDLESYELEEKEWLIEGLIPSGSIGVWTGSRATFKSFLVINASYCISTGTKFLGKYETKKGKVIYLDKENGVPIMKKRGKMIKAGLSIEKADVGYICFSQLKLDKKESVDEIIEIIEEHKPSLLVIDTYRRAISFDENDAGAVSYLFVDILRPIIDKHKNLTILLIHHNRKGGGNGDQMDEIRGSSDLANYCDFILLNKRKGRSIILEQLKNRNAPEIAPIPVKISTDEENYISFEKGEESVLRTADERASEVLLIWISQNRITQFRTGDWVKEAKANGLTKTSYSNALNRIKDAGKIEQISRGLYDVISKEKQGDLYE